MKDEQTGLMEEEILKEEEQTTAFKQAQMEQKKKKTAKLSLQLFYNFAKKVVLGFKRPKIITLVLLFSAVVVIYTALALLASKKQPEEIIQPTVELSSPSPKTITDPTLLKIAQDVNKFKSELVKQEGFSGDLLPPILDLDISFK